MLLLAFLTLIVMSLGLGLFNPLLQALTPALSLGWLGWVGLALGLWLFAAPSGKDPSANG